jgi:hypothetical protein
MSKKKIKNICQNVVKTVAFEKFGSILRILFGMAALGG